MRIRRKACILLLACILLHIFMLEGFVQHTGEFVASAENSDLSVREAEADKYLSGDEQYYRDFTAGILRPDEGTIEMTLRIDKPISEFGNNWNAIINIRSLKPIDKSLIYFCIPPEPEKGLSLLFRNGIKPFYLIVPDFNYTTGKEFNLAITWKAGDKLSIYKDGELLGSTEFNGPIDDEYVAYCFLMPRNQPYNIQKTRISTKKLTAQELNAEPKSEFTAKEDTCLIASNNLRNVKYYKTAWHKAEKYNKIMPAFIAETQCFTDEESVFYPVISINHSESTKNYTVKIEAKDLSDKVVLAKEATITVPNNSKYLISEIMLPELEVQGLYKLNTKIFLDNELVSENNNSISVLPANDKSIPDGVLSKSYGQHYSPSMGASSFKKTNASITRADVFKWNSVEPTKGNFTWDLSDIFVNKFKADDIEILGILGYPSRWASQEPTEQERAAALGMSRTPDCWKPRDIDEWANYIYQTVSRYKDDVQYWEIYNEVNFHPPYYAWSFSGTTEEYIELLKVAYREAKKANPNCKILVSGFAVPHAGTVDNEMPFLLTEAKYAQGYYDIYNVHGYLGPEVFDHCIKNLQKTRPGTKYWQSEEMPFQIEDISKRAFYTVGTYVSFIEHGYEKFIHMGTPSEQVFHEYGTQAPTVGYQAIGVLQNYMRKCDSFVNKYDDFENSGRLSLKHYFKRTDGKYVSILGSHPLSYNISINGQFEKVEDIYGQPVNVQEVDGISQIPMQSILYIVSDQPLDIKEVQFAENQAFIDNGSFEDNIGDIALGLASLEPTGWTFRDKKNDPDGEISISDKSATGKYSVNLKSSGEGKVYIFQDIKIDTPGTYTVTAKMKKLSGDSKLVPFISLYDRDIEAVFDKPVEGVNESDFIEVKTTFDIKMSPKKDPAILLGILSGKGEILIDDVTLNFGSDGKEVTNDSKTVIATKNNGEIIIDGNITEAEWSNCKAIRIDSQEAVIDIDDWEGPKDISADLYVKWDESNLYLAFKVEDDVHSQSNTGAHIWKQDSVQFAFYDSDILLDQRGKCSEIAVALSGEDIVKIRHIAITGKGTGEIDNLECSIRRDGTSTDYELSIPWEEILTSGTKIGDNEKYGISFLINDEDGDGSRGWIEYGSGIGGEKNPLEFLNFVLDIYAKVKISLFIGESNAIINGEKVVLDAPPLLLNSHTMVPMRFIGEALGAELNWEASTETVTIIKEDTKIVLKIGSNTATINDKNIELASAPILNNSRTMVPLRFISEAFGANVDWIEASQEVIITKPFGL